MKTKQNQQWKTEQKGTFTEVGIVFYLFVEGDVDYVAGLVCAVSDRNEGSGIQWCNGSSTSTGVTTSAIGRGQDNTTAIIAKLCEGVVMLQKICEIRVDINNPATSNAGTDLSESSSEPYGIYLSSTEHWDARYARDGDFSKGWFNENAKSKTQRVKVVRAF